MCEVALSPKPWGPVHMGSQVPSPNSHFPLPTDVRKSQQGCKVPTFESQETIKIWLIIMKVGSWLFYAWIFAWLVSRVGSSFLLNPTLNTSHKPHLHKVLPCRHPCHTWDSWCGTVWSGKSHLPGSQGLRLHGLTSSGLGLWTWDTMCTGLEFVRINIKSSKFS